MKEGAVVIDVGMNRDENGRLCGDADFENVKDKTSYITPCPARGTHDDYDAVIQYLFICF